MNPAHTRPVRRSLLLAASLLLTLAALALPGCGGNNAPETRDVTIRTIVAGSRPFGNAIDADGNIRVTNGGNGTPGTEAGCSNYQVFVGAAR